MEGRGVRDPGVGGDWHAGRMTLILAGLYAIAALTELVGVRLTFVDIRAVQQRLREYLSRPIQIFVTDVAAVSDAFGAAVVTGPPPTMEQRVEALEQWRTAVPGQMDEKVTTLRTQMRSELASEVSSLRASVNDRLDGLHKVVGSPDKYWWRGPAVLAAGVLLGAAGNLLSLAS